MASNAILEYVSHGSYPDSESISSSPLTPTDLNTLLTSLRSEQEATRDEIRSLSKSTAGDIDSWISQAKALQADILRSRETARQIVADADAGETLQEDANEKARKVTLLEREVEFNETLSGTLEHIIYANGLIDRMQQAAINADIPASIRTAEDATASILALESFSGSTGISRIVEILRQRLEALTNSLIETTCDFWDSLIVVDNNAKTITINTSGIRLGSPTRKIDILTLDHLVVGAIALEVLPRLTEKFAKDIEHIIMRPRTVIEDGMLVKITIKDDDISARGINHNLSTEALFSDLEAILDFFGLSLPQSVAVPMSDSLIPALAQLLQRHWLDPAIPLDMSELANFNDLVESVESLSDTIDALEWHGSAKLRDWVEDVPRAWLTKRREALLGDVRNLVFSGSRERKTVERIETRVVSQNDPVMTGNADDSADDPWNEEWDEPEDGSSTTNPQPSSSTAQDEDEDDTSAWDVEDESEDKDEMSTGTKEDEEDAWGAWEEDETQKPSSPSVDRKEPPAQKVNGASTAPAEQKMTLRETFTVTAIPDGILSNLQQIVSHAETLAHEEFSSSPLAPAAQGLYTLPTLALAIYRATAPTAYNKIDVGNMLIYNDALRLAELLRSWQNSRSTASGRLRLDNDAAALETFAKRAYASEMESQRTILRDLLDGAQGFSNCTAQPFKAECESAIDGTVARLHDVHRMWKDILSHGALLQSLGSLLSTITGKIISDIEDLGDISEADSHQLHALCQRVTSLTSIFTQASPEGGADDAQQDMTFVYCPTWLKFQYLAEILESSLADIKWMWREGELSLEFEAEEVVDLVQALFADSDLRRQAVREIKAGRR